MKSFYNRFDSQSTSTQSKQRKFTRRSSSRSLKSRQGSSPSSSLSKFWVKDMKNTLTNVQMEKLLSKSINSDPRIPESQNHNNSVKKCEKPKELQKMQKEVETLKKQIKNYELYTKKQSEVIHQLKNKNSDLKEQIRMLREKPGYVLPRRSLPFAENVNEQSEQIQSPPQKEEKSIFKVKLQILQNKISEYERQKILNLKKIEQLSETLKAKDQQIKKYEQQKNTMLITPIIQTNQIDVNVEMQRQRILRQLQQSRNQVQKLQIAHSCLQKKFFSEFQVFRQKKQKQYEELRKKYQYFIDKYRCNMKQFISRQKFRSSRQNDQACLEKENNFFLLSEDEDIDFN